MTCPPTRRWSPRPGLGGDQTEHVCCVFPYEPKAGLGCLHTTYTAAWEAGSPRARSQMAGKQNVGVPTVEHSSQKRKDILSHATQVTLKDLCSVR